MFSAVATITEAGERPAASDGLQTYGGVRALARYVKIRAVPASGGMISFNEVSQSYSNCGTVINSHQRASFMGRGSSSQDALLQQPACDLCERAALTLNTC